MEDNNFYHVRNIPVKCENYSALNDTLQESSANIRLGPALTKKGNPSLPLDETMMGIYMRKENLPSTLRKREAKVTLQEAESKLEKMIEKGIQRVGYGTL